MSTAQKRKLSSNDDAAGKAAKHRSSRACQSCRARKVRCDILVDGNRCTNCRLDDIECVLLESRRGKNNGRNSTSNHERHVSPTAHLPVRATTRSTLPASSGEYTGQDETSAPFTSRKVCAVPVCLTFDEEEVDACNSPFGANSTYSRDHREQISAGAQQLLGLTTPRALSDMTNTYSTPPTNSHIPAFFKPLPSTISDDDIEYLARKGAFTIPDKDLCAEIICNYITTVHPFMPILDLKEFIGTALHDGENGCISILLFQAVMFAGLCSLEPVYVHRLGFETTKQARQAFFKRVRLLYDFDVEPDGIAITQSLLLMSSWYNKWNDRKHTWYWTGLAVSAAQSIGLHRKPTPLTTSSDSERRLRKRLWWSLYIRDRIIALGTRRPMRISDNDHDVPILTAEDFDTDALQDPINGKYVYHSVDQNNRLALMCIELSKLCICIGHVLSYQYTTLGGQYSYPHTMMVIPRRDTEQARELERCDAEINDWYQTLHPKVRKANTIIVGGGPPDSPDWSDIQWDILNLIHLTTVSVLHRPQVLLFPSDHSRDSGIQKASRAKVKEAARGITRIAHSMLRCDRARFLSGSGMTALVSASLAHMMDIRSEDEDIRDASIFRFYQCMQVLQSLRAIYASADSAVSFLASAIQRTGLAVPAQIAAPAPDFMTVAADGFAQLTSVMDGQLQKTNPMSTQSKPLDGSVREPIAGDRVPGMETAQAPLRRATELTDAQVNEGQEKEHLYSCDLPYLEIISAAPDMARGTLQHESSLDRDSQNAEIACPTGQNRPEPNIGPISDELPNLFANELFLGLDSGLDCTYSNESNTFEHDFYIDRFGLLDYRLDELPKTAR